MTTPGDSAASHRRAADGGGGALVRDARATARYRPWRAFFAPVARVSRWLGRGVGEFLSELLVGMLCLGAFALVAGASAWGWAHSRTGTVGVGIAVAVFLAYGIREMSRSRNNGGWPAPGRRLAVAAASTVVVVALWLSYVVQYAPSFF